MHEYVPQDKDISMTFVVRPTGTGTFDIIVVDKDCAQNIEVYYDCSPGLADALLTIQVHIQDRLKQLVKVDVLKNSRIKGALGKLWKAYKEAGVGATDWRKTHDLKKYIKSQITRFEEQSQKNLDPGHFHER